MSILQWCVEHIEYLLPAGFVITVALLLIAREDVEQARDLVGPPD